VTLKCSHRSAVLKVERKITSRQRRSYYNHPRRCYRHEANSVICLATDSTRLQRHCLLWSFRFHQRPLLSTPQRCFHPQRWQGYLRLLRSYYMLFLHSCTYIADCGTLDMIHFGYWFSYSRPRTDCALSGSLYIASGGTLSVLRGLGTSPLVWLD
jgi:hypothetical protein